ncbi:hypothetical protein [Burkholderia gladioli]|uniref:hypothetical protein n=1 Tax=Burkholderia gladioli TaxID=28095 RepID=UPI001641A630|nr:hypothetical protein [Burkholderia gladioli]
MQPIYLTSFVGLAGTVTTLLGVLVANRTQLKNQRLNNQVQIELAREKTNSELTEKSRDATNFQLANAHKIISKINRELSLTGLNITQVASISIHDFNDKYMKLCENADDLMMIVDFYAPDASEDCRALSGQMSMFWGHYQAFLYRATSGDITSGAAHNIEETRKAAIKISEKSMQAKNNILKYMKPITN